MGVCYGWRYDGDFNTAPRGWEEITEQEFAQSKFFTYGFKDKGFRQILRTQEGETYEKMISVYLFYLGDGTGYALSNDYWGGKIRYFRFGCKHEYRELTVQEADELNVYHGGMCYHVYQCKLCGHLWEVDSSE